jgi:hypothetical protein
MKEYIKTLFFYNSISLNIKDVYHQKNNILNFIYRNILYF